MTIDSDSSGPMAPLGRIAICIATYRRPQLLGQLLASLADQVTTVEWRVIVVDNDPAGTGREAVERSPIRDRVEYAVEPRPGIPAVRNRCVALVRPDDDAVVFVDDDETVDPGWLQALVDTAAAWRVEVVAGPVLPLVADDAPWWIRRGHLHDRLPRTTGSMGGSPYTGNSLVTTSLLAGAGIRFDEEQFADTGGEDTDFFRRLVLEPGVPWVWCAEARAYEIVPPDRSTLRWLVRRRIRDGNVIARTRLKNHSRSRVISIGVSRFVLGVLATPVLFAFRPRLTGFAFALCFQGVGIVQVALGIGLVHEYRRVGT